MTAAKNNKDNGAGQKRGIGFFGVHFARPNTKARTKTTRTRDEPKTANRFLLTMSCLTKKRALIEKINLKPRKHEKKLLAILLYQNQEVARIEAKL